MLLLIISGFSTPAVRATDSVTPTKVTFKVLASYPLEETTGPILHPLKDLDGKSVVVTGYVLPVAYNRGRTREFMLMRSQAACCFGQAPKANEFIMVVTEEPEGVPATQDVPTTFSGILRIQPQKLGDVIVQCFRMENARPL